MKYLNWGNALAIALISFIIFILSLIFWYQSQDNSFDLVTENYYEEELVFQKEIDAQNNANKLKNPPVLKITPQGIIIWFDKEFSKITGEVLFRHSSKKEKDIKTKLMLSSENQMTIPASVLDKSLYEVKINWVHNGISYRKDYEIKWN